MFGLSKKERILSDLKKRYDRLMQLINLGYSLGAKSSELDIFKKIDKLRCKRDRLVAKMTLIEKGVIVGDESEYDVDDVILKLIDDECNS